ncbi:MAG: phosphomannomutase/phosphoglucomutase [Pseudomonadota bacterium]
MNKMSCFKAYDIRGRVDEDLDEAFARDLGVAIATVLSVATAVVGRDARASSPRLSDALAEGLVAAGVDVLDLGLCGTEEVYFGTDHFGAEAGIMVTASHNPIAYNGFKIVGAGAAPLTDDVFQKIKAVTAAGAVEPAGDRGTMNVADCRAAYVDRVLSFIAPAELEPLKVLVNAGNGAAGPTFDAVVAGLQKRGGNLTVERLHHDPDANFPNGIPNPLLPENQPVTADAVRKTGADFGVAWDGDFDRCFFFDHTGAFIPGEFVVALLAAAMLERFPGESIVHDPRVFWNTEHVVSRSGGQTCVSKTGHALVKAKMRETGAVYGGEMSAHHYFREFMYCDSGMIPWVLVAAYMSKTGRPMHDLVADMRARFQSSGEVNFQVADTKAAMQRVQSAFQAQTLAIDWLDGLSLETADWRLNLRASNTEPLLRLNVESRSRNLDIPRLVDEVGKLVAD